MTSPGSAIDLNLIGRWWHVALASEVEMARQVRSMVLEATGREDSVAPLRAALRDEVSAAARTARTSGASDFYFARHLVPGAPVPACLAVWWLPDLRSATVTDLEGEAALLADSLGPKPDAPVTVTRLIDGWGVVRQVGTRRPTGEATILEATPVHGARYWLLPPASPMVVMLDFTSPVLALAGPLTEVFDAIVSSVTLRELSPGAPAAG